MQLYESCPPSPMTSGGGAGGVVGPQEEDPAGGGPVQGGGQGSPCHALACSSASVGKNHKDPIYFLKSHISCSRPSL